MRRACGSYMVQRQVMLLRGACLGLMIDSVIVVLVSYSGRRVVSLVG